MDQEDINAALRDLIQGREGPWREVVAGLRDGSIAYTTGAYMVTIKALPDGPVRMLAQYLQALRSQSGISQHDLAVEAGVSLSSTVRTLQGRVLASWPVVRVLVECMGGDVAQARLLWDGAKEARRRQGG